MPRQPRLLDYTPAERTALAAFYPASPPAEVLAALPGRAWNSITMVASEMRIRRNIFWSAADVAVLRAEYPLRGAAAVAELLGKVREAVTRKAYDMGITRTWLGPEARKARKAITNAARHARLMAERPPLPARIRQAPAPKAVRPVVVKAELLVPVKLRPMLPVLNAAKTGRKRAEQAANARVAITAEQVRRLDYSHPGRMAYLKDGVRGWQAWATTQPLG